MTVEEMFNRISGEMTKANNEIAGIINTYGNNMYHLGCIAGEQTAVSRDRSELARVLDALYPISDGNAQRNQRIQLVAFNAEVLYDGRVEDIPKSILEQPYTIWSINVDTTFGSDKRIITVA